MDRLKALIFVAWSANFDGAYFISVFLSWHAMIIYPIISRIAFYAGQSALYAGMAWNCSQPHFYPAFYVTKQFNYSRPTL